MNTTVNQYVLKYMTDRYNLSTVKKNMSVILHVISTNLFKGHICEKGRVWNRIWAWWSNTVSIYYLDIFFYDFWWYGWIHVMISMNIYVTYSHFSEVCLHWSPKTVFYNQFQDKWTHNNKYFFQGYWPGHTRNFTTDLQLFSLFDRNYI